MTFNYLRDLSESFNEWTAQLPKEQVIEVDANTQDFLNNSLHRDVFVNEVGKVLRS